jgi:hypothetical protein
MVAVAATAWGTVAATKETDDGAIFKFIPSTPRQDDAPITNLQPDLHRFDTEWKYFR